ncbi:MAG: SURF1 family protein [Gammaproteobacteria bacterium]|nr:SURF1 family protein [Gammaproteobacteria bacterium]
MQKYQFRPGIWLVLFLGSVMVMTASFGFWQLDRAEQKQQLQSAIDRRSAEQPIALPNSQIDIQDLSAMQHFSGVVRGSWLANKQFLLENVVYKGKVGYYVYTPLLLADGQVLLVNRGWVAASAYREQLPNVELPSEAAEISGRFAAPRSKPIMVGGLPPANANSDAVWFYVDMALLQARVDMPLASFVMLQTSADDTGLVRDWPVFDAKVSMHIGYAIQWFAFTVIAFIFFLIFSFRRSKVEEK